VALMSEGRVLKKIPHKLYLKGVVREKNLLKREKETGGPDIGWARIRITTLLSITASGKGGENDNIGAKIERYSQGI